MASMRARSSPAIGNLWTVDSWLRIAASVAFNIGSLGSTAENAPKISTADDFAARPAGRGRDSSFATKSARSDDSSKSALYIRCRSALPRRTSTMKASFDLRAAM
jgi:hypothetical protein